MEKNDERDGLIHDFERLVDELLKPDPNEHQVRVLMEKLQMTYEKDSVNRISAVIERMNDVIFVKKDKKGDYDLQ